jgi:hypothetical protein
LRFPNLLTKEGWLAGEPKRSFLRNLCRGLLSRWHMWRPRAPLILHWQIGSGPRFDHQHGAAKTVTLLTECVRWLNAPRSESNPPSAFRNLDANSLCHTLNVRSRDIHEFINAIDDIRNLLSSDRTSAGGTLQSCDLGAMSRQEQAHRSDSSQARKEGQHVSAILILVCARPWRYLRVVRDKLPSVVRCG